MTDFKEGDVFPKWNHFYNLPTPFLNITDKTVMLKKYFLHRHSSHNLRTKINITSTFYKSLKVMIT